MPRIGIKRRAEQWKRLLAAARVHEIELPVIGPFADALEESLDDVTATRKRQATLKRQQQEISRELRAHVSSGSEMAIRLKCLVRAGFGRRDERLADFGMKPFGLFAQPERRQNGSPGYH